MRGLEASECDKSTNELVFHQSISGRDMTDLRRASSKAIRLKVEQGDNCHVLLFLMSSFFTYLSEPPAGSVTSLTTWLRAGLGGYGK